jgi:hypothetical protein
VFCLDFNIHFVCLATIVLGRDLGQIRSPYPYFCGSSLLSIASPPERSARKVGET